MTVVLAVPHTCNDEGFDEAAKLNGYCIDIKSRILSNIKVDDALFDPFIFLMANWDLMLDKG